MQYLIMMQYLMWRVLVGINVEINVIPPVGRPHQVCTRLVLWLIQATVQED